MARKRVLECVQGGWSAREVLEIVWPTPPRPHLIVWEIVFPCGRAPVPAFCLLGGVGPFGRGRPPAREEPEAAGGGEPPAAHGAHVVADSRRLCGRPCLRPAPRPAQCPQGPCPCGYMPHVQRVVQALRSPRACAANARLRVHARPRSCAARKRQVAWKKGKGSFCAGRGQGCHASKRERIRSGYGLGCGRCQICRWGAGGIAAGTAQRGK